MQSFSMKKDCVGHNLKTYVTILVEVTIYPARVAIIHIIHGVIIN
jgi:hypothetical protein